MPERAILSWDDVRPAAEEAFCFWVDHPEIRWAEQAWGHVVRYGLAEYSSPEQRFQVCIRFMALAALYADWFHVLHDVDGSEDELEEWAALLNMMPFESGRLSGGDSTLSEIDTEFVRQVLKEATDNARPELFRCLRDGYGGECELYIALWRSSRDEEWNGQLSFCYDGSYPQTDEEILDAAMYTVAWRWVLDGCPAYDRAGLYDG